MIENLGVLVDGLDHPECVAWDEKGRVFAGGEAGQLYVIDLETREFEIVANTKGWILGIALDSSSNAYLCDPKNKCVYKAGKNGHLSKLSDGTLELPMTTPNFPVFDKLGNLYVSDSGNWDSNNGRIYKISPKGITTLWSSAAPNFTNGLAIDIEGRYLYVAESTLPGITKIPINIDGSAGDPELVIAIPNTVPDGLAFNRDGVLFIGCYRPDRIYSFDPIAGLEIVLDDFQGTRISAPTNIAFGGDDLMTLFIASLARWHIGTLKLNTPGQRLNFPKEIETVHSSGKSIE
jgi:gluconolactonase